MISTRNSLILCLATLGLLALPSASWAETLSMKEFLALKPKWVELAKSSESLRVEGRVESASPRLIRLKKCPLPFRPVQGNLPDLRRPTSRVELSGHLRRRGTETVFEVVEMLERPDDLQHYALREAALDSGDPGDWYDIAAWAEERGKFYSDDSLLSRAQLARRRGLALEREAASGDADKLVSLAAKAKDFDVPELNLELLHEAFRVRWQTLATDPKTDLTPLTNDIRKSLPGADSPLQTWPMELAARYASEPLATYNRATEEERPALDRVFFAEVQLASLERMARPEGANGEQIASQIDTILPERADIAESYRLREIDYRLDRIEYATRAEALGLAKRLEERNRPDEAKRALTKWLGAREAASRQDGPSGLMSVAEDYVSVLGDKETAAKLLLELLEASPGSDIIPSKLRDLGYVELNGEWLSKEEAATRPVDPVVQAMREGRVVNGFSPEQVRKTLGKPDRVAQAASSSQIHEIWIYGEPGRGGLAVHFLRYSARDRKGGQVVGVTSLNR